jgi:hypothetical protein
MKATHLAAQNSQYTGSSRIQTRRGQRRSRTALGKRVSYYHQGEKARSPLTTTSPASHSSADGYYHYSRPVPVSTSTVHTWDAQYPSISFCDGYYDHSQSAPSTDSLGRTRPTTIRPMDRTVSRLIGARNARWESLKASEQPQSAFTIQFKPALCRPCRSLPWSFPKPVDELQPLSRTSTTDALALAGSVSMPAN